MFTPESYSGNWKYLCPPNKIILVATIEKKNKSRQKKCLIHMRYTDIPTFIWKCIINVKRNFNFLLDSLFDCFTHKTILSRIQEKLAFSFNFILNTQLPFFVIRCKLFNLYKAKLKPRLEHLYEKKYLIDQQTCFLNRSNYWCVKHLHFFCKLEQTIQLLMDHIEPKVLDAKKKLFVHKNKGILSFR